MKSVALILCVIGVAFAEQSAPVFMWNVNSAVKPALGLVSQNEFADIVSPFLADNALVVFVEKHLMNKDFSCSKDHSPQSCFAHLQSVSGKNFYTSVDQPLESLQSLSNAIEQSSVDNKGVVTPPLNIENGKITFIRFDDDDSSDRRETLERHDFIMESITSQLKGKNVFFAYTSETASVMRVRRSTGAIAGGFIYRDPNDKLMLFYNSIYLTDNKGFNTYLNFTGMKVEPNVTYLNVTLEGTKPLTFDVILAGGYYFMNNVKVGEVTYRSSEVYAPTTFSYFCGNLTLYAAQTTTNDRTLKLNAFQFQAPFENVKKANFSFGDPWHCVGFFSGSILSGLLIVALLLSILFVGVCWMMDINTMDRFDDPKGKTITINAAD